MRSFQRAVTIMGIVAGTTAGASIVMTGCSGDDTTNTDSGPDGKMDVVGDQNTNDAPIDTGVDAKDDVTITDGGPGPVAKFKADIANAFCARFQNCCNASDAGPFDNNKCLQTATIAAWNGSNAELTPEVLARGNVKLDSTASQACLAELATLSCPVITSNEALKVTDDCYNAAVGTLPVGGNCILSIECQKGEYCKFAGVDAGKSDAGTTQGQCANLIAQGSNCGQTPPYGDPAYASTECAWRGWHSPAEFCDYDTYPDASGYKCQALRSNNAACFADNECASGMCGNALQDCINTACSCLTSRNYLPFCTALKIKDAGPG